MVRIEKISGLTPLLNIVCKFGYEEKRATPLLNDINDLFLFHWKITTQNIMYLKY